METPPQESQQKLSSVKFWVVIVLAAVLLVLVALVAVRNAPTPEERALQEAAENYQRSLSEYEAAMRADTWGGQTPEETLQLFIAALEAGDVDLAAKYFMLETDESSPDYLTRRKWEVALQQAKDEGRLGEMIVGIEQAKMQPFDRIFPEYAVFEVPENSGGEVPVFVNMQLNKLSNFWKISGI